MEWIVEAESLTDFVDHGRYTIHTKPLIRCKDCKHYEWMSNRVPEEQTWHCHCWDADTGKDDFCSYAERKEVET